MVVCRMNGGGALSAAQRRRSESKASAVSQREVSLASGSKEGEGESSRATVQCLLQFAAYGMASEMETFKAYILDHLLETLLDPALPCPIPKLFS